MKTLSRKSVAAAGQVLADPTADGQSKAEALRILSEWRRLHGLALATFQTTLRQKCRHLPSAVIAQRLKRTPSIVAKLSRYPDMSLARMQDIGGLRAVLPTVSDVYAIHESYLESRRMSHEVVLPPKDYIANPKSDGYRCLHQVFKYRNTNKPELDGLRIELQLRTQLQHCWATSVETLGILDNTLLKSGQGNEDTRRFFLLCSAWFAHVEKTPLPQGVGSTSEILAEMIGLDDRLGITGRLEQAAKVAKKIETSAQSSDYYVMMLDLETHGTSLIPFTKQQADMAEAFYAMQEQQQEGRKDVVLISAGSVRDIRKAYPNYFMDTKRFVKEVREARLKFK